MEFAKARHGYWNSNNGTGITYPGDLDEYQKVVDKISISAGSVLVSLYQDPMLSCDGREQIVPEYLYLETLAKVLKRCGMLRESASIATMVTDARTAYNALTPWDELATSARSPQPASASREHFMYFMLFGNTRTNFRRWNWCLAAILVLLGAVWVVLNYAAPLKEAREVGALHLATCSLPLLLSLSIGGFFCTTLVRRKS